MTNSPPSHRLLGIAIFVLSVQPFIHAGSAQLCREAERSIFSCSFANGKSVSVCAHNVKSSGEYMEYRFGKPGNVEMSLVAKGASASRFHKAEILYASNAEEILWVKNKSTIYMIHLPVRGSPSLEVRDRGKTLAHFQCQHGWGGTTVDLKDKSPFVIDHGSVSDTEISKLQGDE